MSRGEYYTDTFVGGNGRKSGVEIFQYIFEKMLREDDFNK